MSATTSPARTPGSWAKWTMAARSMSTLTWVTGRKLPRSTRIGRSKMISEACTTSPSAVNMAALASPWATS